MVFQIYLNTNLTFIKQLVLSLSHSRFPAFRKKWIYKLEEVIKYIDSAKGKEGPSSFGFNFCICAFALNVLGSAMSVFFH